jgi:predicted 3-demethylubiquinone-9 3-methyltransferase (glyoxalase superfamily)
MHGMLETDAGYTIMAADITRAMKHHPMAGFSVSLSGDGAGALRGYWEKLSTGGTTTMPMQKQIRGDEFGMCVDKFGVSWLADISQPRAWQLIRAHGRPTLPGDAGAVQEVRAIDITPVRRRRQGYWAVLPYLHARATGRAPRFAARPRTAIRAPLDVRLRKMDPRSSDPPSVRPSTEATGRPSSSSWQATADPFQPAPPERGTNAWYGGWRYAAAPR